MNLMAGLLCKNAEIISDDQGKNYSVVGGRVLPFKDTPAEIIAAIDNTMDAGDHRELDKMGIYDVMARRDQWATCNLSRSDNEPDFIHGQQTVNREFVECSKRGSCVHEKKLCRTQAQLSGLTSTQLTVLTYTGEGLLNKEIAVKMRISIETVASHHKNIRIRTGAARKADLVRYAQKLNLISNQ